MDEQGTTKPITADGADVEGAMVALEVPPNLRAQLAVEGGEPPDRLHVTLAYFEDAAADRDDWPTLQEALQPIVTAHGEVRVTLGGQGFFEQEDGRVHWLAVDAPGLNLLREQIVEAAEGAGFAVRQDHGFQPHITLTYADAGSEPPSVDLPEGEQPFGVPVLFTGGTRTLLTASATPITAALEIDGTEVPLNPPGDWFEPPSGGIPTDRRITVEPGGRVYGYIALWNACHVGADGCVPPPKGSPSDYELAHPGQTVTADGETIRTANIGGDVGHAPGDLNPWDAASFYENVATQLMRVRYGEDENGLWFAGALWPNLSEIDVARIQAASISGDWRWEASWRTVDDGGYDYTGAVLVNLPGFPMEADGGVSTESGFLRSIAASARKDGFDGIVSLGDRYMITDGSTDDGNAGDKTMSTTADGGGCGCGGGGGKQIKAGSFEGTVEDLAGRIAEHVRMALDEAGASDSGDDAGPTDGEPVEMSMDDLAAAITAAIDGDETDPITAVNMKLDQVLAVAQNLEAIALEGQAERLAAKAIE